MEQEQTAMQSILKFLDSDVELKMFDKKSAERLKWYIETYFLKDEKQQIIDSHAFALIEEDYDKNAAEYRAEQYYNNKYNKQ